MFKTINVTKAQRMSEMHAGLMYVTMCTLYKFLACICLYCHSMYLIKYEISISLCTAN